MCFWRSKASAGSWKPASSSGASRSIASLASDRWDAGLADFRRPSTPDAVRRCLSNQSWLLLGDSTVRDTFYELLAMLGQPMSSAHGAWPKGESEPRASVASYGEDRLGKCGAVSGPGHSRCSRYARITGTPGRVRYRMVVKPSEAMDAATESKGFKEPSAIFLQCPIWEAFAPDAYNYSLSSRERHLRRLNLRRLGSIARSCAQAFEGLAHRYPRARRYWLGPAPDPGMLDNQTTAELIVGHFHTQLGLACRHGSTGTGGYTIASGRGITPLDRFNIIGRRTREGIHPLFNAHFALVMLMMRHQCRPPSARPAARPAEERKWAAAPVASDATRGVLRGG